MNIFDQHLGRVTGFRAPEWMSAANCASTDPELFYPERGGSTREAKAICRSCPVVADCLSYAMEHQERFGVWGALSERERRRLGRSAA
jgi:WhiB family transcriptional regulator, redox-sensing transcriptional regulator